MKKQVVLVIFGILAVFLLLVGCVNDRPIKKSAAENISIETIAIGKYGGMAYSLTSSFMPTLTLEDNDEFEFELGIGNSIRGTYKKVDNNKLVLTSSGEGESYVLVIAEHTLIFEQEIPGYVKKNTKFVLIAEQATHYSQYPQLNITNGTNKIIWTWGDANYTSDPSALIGNTDFGLDIERALQTPVSVVRPESQIEFKADEVAGLEKPTYKVRLVDSNKQLQSYPMNQNSIILPKAEDEYLFQLQVHWGNENHEIYYWFHVETQMFIQPPVATNITMEDKIQAEQVIREYLNYLDKQNYEEAWKLLAPQDRAGQTKESFMVVHQGVKAIKLISIKGYSVVAGNNGSAIVYDEKVPTVDFHLLLDVVPMEGSAWGEGRNERFVVGRKGIDGEWLVSGFATSP